MLEEGLAQHRGVLHDPALVLRESVQTRGDERVKRLGHRERLDGPGRRIDRTLLNEQAAIQEHADGLDRVQRHALGAIEDLIAELIGKARDQSGQELGHRVGRQRLEVDRGEAALARAPSGSPLVDLGPGQRQDEDPVVAGPLQQILDEVEQAGVGPLHVLEDHHDRVALGQALEEGAPGGEHVLLIARGAGVDREQVRETGFDPRPFLGVGDELLQGRAQLRLGGRRLLVF